MFTVSSDYRYRHFNTFMFILFFSFLVAPFLENGATYLLSIVSVGMFVCMWVGVCVCVCVDS